MRRGRFGTRRRFMHQLLSPPDRKERPAFEASYPSEGPPAASKPPGSVKVLEYSPLMLWVLSR